MTVYDPGNLLCTWERSLKVLQISMKKIIKHLENDRPDNAGVRAKETLKTIELMQKGIEAYKTHLCGTYHTNIEHKL